MSLVIDNLSAAYGDTRVLWDVSMQIGPGETVALIGSNGAGKSSLLGAISGLVKHLGGGVRFGEHDLSNLTPDEIVKFGVVQVPQGRRLFGALTVHENLLMGAYLRRDADIASDLERVLELFPRLKERYTFLAGRLSGGEQQQVAIARAMMARPKVMLIDEMSLGLAPVLVDQLLEILASIHRSGVAILMVEQDVQTALEFAERAYVLETGRVVLAGPCARLLDDPACAKPISGCSRRKHRASVGHREKTRYDDTAADNFGDRDGMVLHDRAGFGHRCHAADRTRPLARLRDRRQERGDIVTRVRRTSARRNDDDGRHLHVSEHGRHA